MLDAVNFAYEAGLQDKYPPVPLLKSYLDESMSPSFVADNQGQAGVCIVVNFYLNFFSIYSHVTPLSAVSHIRVCYLVLSLKLSRIFFACGSFYFCFSIIGYFSDNCELGNFWSMVICGPVILSIVKLKFRLVATKLF
jgi:Frigida-like protein